MLATAPVQGRADPRVPIGQLPDDAHINAAELANLLNISVRSLDRLMKAGNGPKSVSRLGVQIRRWRMATVRTWLESTAAQSA